MCVSTCLCKSCNRSDNCNDCEELEFMDRVNFVECRVEGVTYCSKYKPTYLEDEEDRRWYL